MKCIILLSRPARNHWLGLAWFQFYKLELVHAAQGDVALSQLMETMDVNAGCLVHQASDGAPWKVRSLIFADEAAESLAGLFHRLQPQEMNALFRRALASPCKPLLVPLCPGGEALEEISVPAEVKGDQVEAAKMETQP